MKDGYFSFQLVGNDTSIKRMVASLYLLNAKQQEQTLKVCICDDLPHVVKALNERMRGEASSEALQEGLSVSVNYARTLTISASVMHKQESVCTVTPDYEVVIPPEQIWSPGAMVVIDFKVQMLKANEDASVQISILSQDDEGNEIPLSVAPRAHLFWQPKNVAGVTRLREAWESSSEGSISPQRRSWATRQGPQPYLHNNVKPSHKSVSLPRYQQPGYSKVETLVQKKRTRMQEVEEELRREEERMKREEERAKREEERKAASANVAYDQAWNRVPERPTSQQGGNWNIVQDPRPTAVEYNGGYEEPGQPLPDWAKGLGEDFNYDDVMVV